MCITLVANIIWRSSHAIRSSFLLDFFFSTIVADLFSQFCTSQLCNMIVFAAKSYFQCTKKWSRRTRLALRTIISIFKYSYQAENAKKKISVTGT